jgi:hypothetical protein
MGPKYVPLVIGWVARCLGLACPRHTIDEARAAIEASPRELQRVIEEVLSGRRYRIWPQGPSGGFEAVTQDAAWVATRLVDLLDDEWSGLTPESFSSRLWERSDNG